MAHRILLCVFALLTGVTAAAGQELEPAWQALQNGPASPTGRHEDVTFINEKTGWVVNLKGQVHRTVDGGETWEMLYENPNYSFRSVAFGSANRGWIGGIFSQGDVLFETFDGGRNWLNVTGRLKSPPGGICGIQALSDQVVYAVGAFYGGPWFVKTTNGGQTWTSSLLGTDAKTLVDLYFKNENDGWAVGGTANTEQSLHGDAVVLHTTNGGATWRTVHRTDHGDGVAGEWGWKISFPSEQVGYVSIEYTGNPNGQAAKFLKTTDGGLTWTAHFIPTSVQASGLQGIGFVTEDLGWASGRGQTSVTRDGGETWERVLHYEPTARPDGGLDGATNRIFVVNENVAFAVGKYTYKFDASVPAGVESIAGTALPRLFTLDQNYPNPFSTSTTIGYTLFDNAGVRITVHDVMGRRVRVLVDTFQPPGPYRIAWDGADDVGNRVASGAYLYLLDIGNQIEMKQAVVLND